MAEQGWIGMLSQVTYFLRVVRADKDEDGKFLVDGDVASFLGQPGENVEVVVPAGTCYFVGGQRCNLAAGLRSTSYDVGVYVI
jgi:hypothetical protein